MEQNNCATKIVNAYIVYDLDDWLKILLDNIELKNCLFGATNIVKNRDKSKWMYRGCRIVFDGSTSWSIVNDFVWNVVIFGVDVNSSSHGDNRKSNF